MRIENAKTKITVRLSSGKLYDCWTDVELHEVRHRICNNLPFRAFVNAHAEVIVNPAQCPVIELDTIYA